MKEFNFINNIEKQYVLEGTKMGLYMFFLYKDGERYAFALPKDSETTELYNKAFAFHLLYGMPDKVEVHSECYALDYHKVIKNKKYKNMQTESVYELIVNKYGSIKDSPFSAAFTLTHVYKGNKRHLFCDFSYNSTEEVLTNIPSDCIKNNSDIGVMFNYLNQSSKGGNLKRKKFKKIGSVENKMVEEHDFKRMINVLEMSLELCSVAGVNPDELFKNAE